MSNTLEYLINITHLPSPSEVVELPIDDKALKTFARVCDVLVFNNLSAKFRFKRWRKHGVTVYCDFNAKLEQECVATLKPVLGRINKTIERQFIPEKNNDYKMPEIIDGEMILDPEANDLPDILESDSINLWDILTEELILAIDPFPRAAGVETSFGVSEEEIHKELVEQTHNPFSDLKTLITEKKTNK